MHRLFVGLKPPAIIRTALIGMMGGVPHARWQSDDQLHLTIRFIGDVDRHQAEDIAAALGTITAPAPIAAIDGVGTFATRGRVDTLWAGVAPHDPLVALHQKVSRALATAAIPADRRAYLPHITLARHPRSAPSGPSVDLFLARHAGLTSDPFRLSHLFLFESHLGREGASYEAIGRWPLTGD
jgi:2'-5' RNA ligase